MEHPYLSNSGLELPYFLTLFYLLNQLSAQLVNLISE